MTNVKVDVRDGDVIRALKVFKKKVERESFLRDLRRQAYALRPGETPCQKGEGSQTVQEDGGRDGVAASTVRRSVHRSS